MQPLIDGDVLLYEIGYGAETGWQHPGFPPFDFVADMVDNRIGNICAITESTQPPIVYFTGNTNFRTEIAVTRKYKDRPSLKPFHYYNIRAYIKGKYDFRCTEGLEADDLMAIEQTRREEILEGNPLYSGPTVRSIICTRDKDLRAVPGWHFGWELGNQPQFGPEATDEFGWIRLSSDRRKIEGMGFMFFCSQLLTGDRVDTIPGIPKCGAVKAFETLLGCSTTREALKRVYGAYRAFAGHDGYKYMLEQGRLLWMTRRLREDGSPILWGQTS